MLSKNKTRIARLSVWTPVMPSPCRRGLFLAGRIDACLAWALERSTRVATIGFTHGSGMQLRFRCFQ
jgi:hypothetical protein